MLENAILSFEHTAETASVQSALDASFWVIDELLKNAFTCICVYSCETYKISKCLISLAKHLSLTRKR